MQTAAGLRFVRTLTRMGEEIPAWVEANRRNTTTADATERRRHTDDVGLMSRVTPR